MLALLALITVSTSRAQIKSTHISNYFISSFPARSALSMSLCISVLVVVSKPVSRPTIHGIKHHQSTPIHSWLHSTQDQHSLTKTNSRSAPRHGKEQGKAIASQGTSTSGLIPLSHRKVPMETKRKHYVYFAFSKIKAMATYIFF